MKNEFDVIIIGAGPAGLKCAEQFKGTNLSVLLIEKNKVIGPKVCAGGLASPFLETEIPESKIRKFDRQTIYFLDKKYEINFIRPLRIINRYDLGQYLLNRIKNSSNITILKNSLVKKIEKDKVFTDKGIFYYRNLVGADGSFSVVRKYLGIPSKLLVGMRYKSSQITDKLIVYFDFELLKANGYFWVFPHIDYTNVGIGFDPKILNARKAEEKLRDFLKKNNYLNKEKDFYRDFGAALINYSYKGCVFGNIFLVGDAAGLVSKATGEGIIPALVSGEEIGKKILDPNYQMGNLDRILKIKKRQEMLRNIFDLSPLFKKEFFKMILILFKRQKFQSYYFGD